MTGLYVHIPFCLRKCPYCDFYSVKFSPQAARDYCSAVISSLSSFPAAEKIDTVYFGGGTPCLLPLDCVSDLLSAFSKYFDLSSDSEITVEVNPAAVDKNKLTELRALGVNRVSIGAQSFDNGDLLTLGRLHNEEQARSCVFDAFDAGFKNISCDLMICLPWRGQTTAQRTLAGLSGLPISHVSCYMLKIEDGTPFAERGITPPDDEACRSEYLQTAKQLEDAGFAQYEISNFAKPGFECRHNLKYWRREEYIGLGASAHSFFFGKRFAVEKDIAKFIKNPTAIYYTDEKPDPFEENLMLRLRLSEGYELDMFPQKRIKIEKKLPALINNGLLLENNGKIMLTKQGFLLSNSIISSLIY